MELPERGSFYLARILPRLLQWQLPVPNRHQWLGGKPLSMQLEFCELWSSVQWLLEEQWPRPSIHPWRWIGSWGQWAMSRKLNIPASPGIILQLLFNDRKLWLHSIPEIYPLRSIFTGARPKVKDLSTQFKASSMTWKCTWFTPTLPMKLMRQPTI